MARYGQSFKNRAVARLMPSESAVVARCAAVIARCVAVTATKRAVVQKSGGMTPARLRRTRRDAALF